MTPPLSPLPLVALLWAAVFATVATATPNPAMASPRGGITIAQDEPADQPAEDPQSAAALLVRVDRLENKLRSLTGQIEQLQFQNKRLEDALRKMQQDVDFRFQDLNRGTAPGGTAPAGGRPPQKRGDLGATSPDATADAGPAPGSDTTPSAPSADADQSTPAKPRQRGDAFDPAADPEAVGAPKPLGTTTPSAPLVARGTPAATASPSPGGGRPAGDPHAPLDLTHGGLGGSAPATTDAPGPSASVETPDPIQRPVPGGATAPAGTASLAPGGTRGEYDADYALYKAGQFDAAAGAFQDFVQKYPRDRLLPEATYFLGESYARLGRQREAAEQFLKVSTDFNRSNRAPDALLRLGIALNALGAKEQACATYQEVDRKYPTAGADVRASVERELKRARC